MNKVFKTYYKNGTIRSERWVKNNALHRTNSPAYIRYYNTGIKSQIIWFEYTKRHRIDGPAVINFDENGSILSKLYFINDINYSFYDWLNKTPILKYKKVEIKLRYTRNSNE